MSSLLRSQDQVTLATSNKPAWGYGMFAAALFVMLLMAEVPLRIALIASAVVAIQTFTGIIIYSWSAPNRKSPLAESISIGFAIGAAISTLSYLLIAELTDRTFAWSVGWLTPAFVITIVKLRNRNQGNLKISSPGNFSPNDLLLIVAVAFLYLGQDFRWALPVFVSGICLYGAQSLRHLGQTKFLVVRIALIAVSVAAMTRGLLGRSPFWWFITDDFQGLEALSSTITKFGPTDPFGAQATIGMKYHIMTYAYSGHLAALTNSPPFMILNHVLPVITALMISAIVWAFIDRDGGRSVVTNMFLVSIYPVFWDYSFTSPSRCFSLFFLLVAIFFWTDRRVTPLIRYQIPITALLAIFIITTKISNLPMIIGGLASLTIAGFALKKSWKWIAATNFTTAFLIILIYSAMFLVNNRTSRQINSMYLFSQAYALAGDLVNMSSRPYRITATLLYTSLYLAIPIFGLIYFLFRERKDTPPLLAFSLPAIPLAIGVAFFGDKSNTGYFILSALNVLNLVLIIGISREIWNERRSSTNYRKIVLLSSSAAGAGVFIYRLLPKYNGGTDESILVRSFLSAHWITAIVTATIFMLLFFRRIENKRSFYLFSILITGITITATFGAITATNLSKGPDLTVSESSIALGTPDEVSTGLWLRANTKTNTIIASNHFCGRACTGTKWFDRDMSQLGDSLSIPRTETGFGGTNFVLSAYARRRFLIEGTYALLAGGIEKQDAIQRMSASLNFANSPDAVVLETLKDYGVTYFVVEKQSTAHTNWEAYSNTVYENETFLILALR